VLLELLEQPEPSPADFAALSAPVKAQSKIREAVRQVSQILCDCPLSPSPQLVCVRYALSLAERILQLRPNLLSNIAFG